MTRPCGSWRVTEFFEGYERSVKWCERTEGPCPFPATEKSRGHGVDLGCAHDLEMVDAVIGDDQ